MSSGTRYKLLHLWEMKFELIKSFTSEYYPRTRFSQALWLLGHPSNPVLVSGVWPFPPYPEDPQHAFSVIISETWASKNTDMRGDAGDAAMVQSGLKCYPPTGRTDPPGNVGNMFQDDEPE